MWAVMIAETPASIAARNGSSASGRSVVDRRQLEVRVLQRVAVPREVLGARGDAAGLEPRDESGHMARDELRVRAERANADDRVVRGRVHVRDRCEVEVDARAGQVGGHRAGHGPRQLDVVDDPERPVSGIRAAFASLEARDVAALLVDGDHELGPLGAECVSQRTQLCRVAHVPRIEDDAAKPGFEQPTNPVRWLLAREAGQQAAQGEALELAGRHGVTP